MGESVEKGISLGFCKKIFRYYVEHPVQVFNGIYRYTQDNYCLYCPKQKSHNAVEPSKHAQFYDSFNPFAYEVGQYDNHNEDNRKHYYVKGLLGNLEREPLFCHI